jgi:hypothetical protein
MLGVDDFKSLVSLKVELQEQIFLLSRYPAYSWDSDIRRDEPIV